MTKEEIAALVSAYKGPITKIEPGKSNNFSDREWHKAVRGNIEPLVARDVAEVRESERRHLDLMDQAAEIRYSGHRVTGYDATRVYSSADEN